MVHVIILPHTAPTSSQEPSRCFLILRSMGKNLGEVRELGEFIPPTSIQGTLLQSSEVLLWETISQRNLEKETQYHQERMASPFCSAAFPHLGVDPQVADCRKVSKLSRALGYSCKQRVRCPNSFGWELR